MFNNKIQKERIKKLVDRYNNLSEDEKKKMKNKVQSLKLKEQKTLIFVVISGLLIILGTIISINLSTRQNDLLIEATGVINLGVEASKNQSVLTYNQDNYWKKCETNYGGYNNESCISAINNDLVRERETVLLSFNNYQNSWKNFSKKLEKNQSNNLDILMKLCFVFAFITSSIGGWLNLKQKQF